MRDPFRPLQASLAAPAPSASWAAPCWGPPPITHREAAACPRRWPTQQQDGIALRQAVAESAAGQDSVQLTEQARQALRSGA